MLSFIIVSNSALAQSWLDNNWKYRIVNNITETIGVPRIFEPIDKYIFFSDSIIKDANKEIRVSMCIIENSSICNKETEIPSQIYNETYEGSYLISANIVFLANVSGYSWRYFYIYYENSASVLPKYISDLRLINESFDSVAIENNRIRIRLNTSYGKEKSGFIFDMFSKVGSNKDWLNASEYEGSNIHPVFNNSNFFRNDDKNYIINGSVFILFNYSSFDSKFWYSYYIFSNNGLIKLDMHRRDNITRLGQHNYLYAYDFGVDTISLNRSNIIISPKCAPADTGIVDVTDNTLSEGWISYYDVDNGSNYNETFVQLWNNSKNNTANGLIRIDVTYTNHICQAMGSYQQWKGTANEDDMTFRFGILNNLRKTDRYKEVSEYWNTQFNHPLIISIEKTEQNNFLSFIAKSNIPYYLNSSQFFTINLYVTDSSNNPITNLTPSDFKVFRENQQTNFTNFRNHNNGTYSLTLDSGNIIGNVSFRVEAGGASAEAFSSVTIKPKSNIVFIASGWEDIFSSGLTGKPIFANYSDTEKYYFSKILPEQVFVFGNITADYPTYRFKDRRAFLETFYSNETAIFVSNKEQAIAAAPFARLKNYPILFNPDENDARHFNNIINLSGKTPDEINDFAIKEFLKAGKNINTIIITNPNSKTSALAGTLSAKHNAIIIPLNFSSISYPETITDFFSLNSANGVMKIRAKINETIKKLSDSFLFSNSIDYKVGRIQLNLILLGNVSEVPQPVVFDSGREMFFDYDKNYLLTDFPYSDTNSDGKADIIVGRIVSLYQTIELPKTNRIVTAAIYRNFETVFSGNGLIESQTTDTAFRTAGFETIRLVENRTNLSYYELTFGFGNITDFLKTLFKDQSISESLKLLDTIYSGYNEFLEHNYYRMAYGMSIGFDGLKIKMFPDERLTRDSLLSQMQNTDGIFYYGKGGNDYWLMESFKDNRIYFSEFPMATSLIYDERTNSARFPERIVFEKGISALVGSSGIIYDTYSFMPNARFAQNMAKNKTVALSLENSRYPLLPDQIKNLTASLQFNYQPERDLSIKQFLQMVCYCDPEKKIDPDAQESGINPIINYSATFKSKIKIQINYFVSGNRIFFDAGQYLQEMGKPEIPLYSAETILPNGSSVIGISFNYNLSKYENITVDFVPVYEQFNQTIEPVHGFYPSQMFYNETFGLLDGRKSVKLIATGMQYNNDTKEALVLDGAEAVIEYAAPFEFLGFSAKNISTDNNQTFGINAVGNNLSVVIDIKSGNFSETVERKIPSAYTEISWKPPFAGEFSATAHILMENNSAGPRYAYFSVNAPSFVFFNSAKSFGINGYERIMKSLTEKMRFAFNGAMAIIEYINPFRSFSSSANSSSIEKSVSDRDYLFSVSQDSGKAVYKIKGSEGELVIEKNAGATKEVCKGDCSELYGKMDSRLSKMQELQDYVVENIGK